MKYSDLMLDWLREAGYRKCFFVAGGNIMHLLESARHRFDCRPFVHEVAAVVAAEYFNAVSSNGKAFALITAGPGLTNAVTGIAGAFLESRFVLIVGGQVKTSDLAGGVLRQRGIQEIDGASIVRPITVAAVRIERPIERAEIDRLLASGEEGRPGPVFLEICLDVQGAPVTNEMRSSLEREGEGKGGTATVPLAQSWQRELTDLVGRAERPVILLGGGTRASAVRKLLPEIERAGIPVMTTWNGADRLSADHPLYFGRPNSWGQRYSNILVQQADLILALGTRLGLQQTGFNWEGFAPVGEVVQVDLDPDELAKGHPRVRLPIQEDASKVLQFILGLPNAVAAEWVPFCREVKGMIPLVEEGINKTGNAYISPYAFVSNLAEIADQNDVIIPCSSGGAFTVMMQVFSLRHEQRMLTNKGLASMGYGLSGAIGAAMAAPDRRVILVEGDGGFAQNSQELGTAAVNRLNLKIFIFDDNGYASIRMTQRNYFGGDYIGCDTSTGLGLPNWEKLFEAYDIPVHRLSLGWNEDSAVLNLLNSAGPAAFLVSIDPEQTYFPKINSRMTEKGTMMSNPLHAMSPPLPDEVAARVYRYVPNPF